LNFKKIFFVLLIYLFTTFELLSNEKTKIIDQLNNLSSIEFTFNQLINNKEEKGNCLLVFPGKLKCEYFDNKQKELVINNKKLSITQKRYKKTYHYPISKSPFLNILYKDKLLEIVNKGKIEKSNNIIRLIYNDENEIAVLFDKKNLELKGWEIKDQYNNNIIFLLNIISRNDTYPNNSFKIPDIN
jgi:outer membrane lipoprotein-sorting protein